MIVNGKELKEANVLTPFEDKTPFNGVSYGQAESGYDIRISQDVHFKSFLFGLIKWITVVHYDISKLNLNGDPIYKPVKKERFFGTRFVLASAMEYFKMPNNMCARATDKSTWARRGVQVFNTTIEPGWKGYLTLELVFNANKSISILRGSGISQVLFESVTCPANYDGKYQNQSNHPVKPITSL